MPGITSYFLSFDCHLGGISIHVIIILVIISISIYGIFFTLITNIIIAWLLVLCRQSGEWFSSSIQLLNIVISVVSVSMVSGYWTLCLRVLQLIMHCLHCLHT